MFWPPMDIDERQNIGAIPTAWTPPAVFDRCSSVANHFSEPRMNTDETQRGLRRNHTDEQTGRRQCDRTLV